MSKLEENDAEKESKNDKEDGGGKKRKEGKYKPSRNVPQFFQDDKDGDNVSEFVLFIFFQGFI